MSGDYDEILIPVNSHQLHGVLTIPDAAQGIVVFAHGSGSSRWSPRNQAVAKSLQDAGFATLLMDLLDDAEAADRDKVFDIDLLAERVQAAIEWTSQQRALCNLPIGLFGASTGAAAALEAAARMPRHVRAVVSRGGRPDLAWALLPEVNAPTLLIVGGRDEEVLALNRKALRRLGGSRSLRVVSHATHLFEEPGALAEVAKLARDWFTRHLCPAIRDTVPSRFADRADAGRRLARRLRERTLMNPLVLAIPRGGIVLGEVLADALGAELDVVLARKLRMPGNPEFALGAIGEDGEVFVNPEVQRSDQLESYLQEEARHQFDEIERRRQLFREGRAPASATGRSVLVVDDGIATGSTMMAALRTLKLQKPLEVIVAVPVGAPNRLNQVRAECDEVVCLIEAPELNAVGEFYDDFTQVEDEEVVAALRRSVHGTISNAHD
ncbi:MAG TPA: alpha/beta fold hydrolase [Gemmataceae bacterium]|nr:alpha/beta fold hydrolase [Gemmataceae bacterium]